MKPAGITVFLPVFIICLLIILGCGDEDRYRYLTFFFDGVPPLGGEEEFDVADPNVIDERGVRQEIVWYIHEPQRKCERCHGNRKQRSFSREVQLTNAVPQLCYECHANMENLKGRVHGPVAVGECLLCHEPHKTLNKYLLLKAPPDLCFQCHDPKAIELIENHDQDLYAKCLDCHAGHTSKRKYLLKEEFQKSVDTSGVLVEIGEPNSLAKFTLQ